MAIMGLKAGWTGSPLTSVNRLRDNIIGGSRLGPSDKPQLVFDDDYEEPVVTEHGTVHDMSEGCSECDALAAFDND